MNRDNLNQAYKRVKANGGSHGVDGMKVDELLPYLKQHGAAIRQALLVARKVKDRRVLKLIRAYLESGAMVNGVAVEVGEGFAQGGPLSPLLSNIMLDELDNIYVKSQRDGERVMQSVTGYPDNVLKLTVNKEKSPVDRPWKRRFLGFSFHTKKGGIGIRVHVKPVVKFRDKVREILSRSNGRSTEQRIKELNRCIIGWVNYFNLADMNNLAKALDPC